MGALDGLPPADIYPEFYWLPNACLSFFNLKQV
jgi:hypothetical protein